MSEDTSLEKATLGGGCFWCLEAVFQQLEGVREVISGYSGGHAVNPTYREVCRGDTGHAEVVQLDFDPGIIDYREILHVFFTIHDPTQLNRQGPDVGEQYRSIIFYHNPDQRRQAEELLEELAESKGFEEEIVTKLEQFDQFYRAEPKHQDFYSRNKNQSYCTAVINPKLEQAAKVFADKFNV